MTEEQLAAAAEHMAESREQYVKEIHLHVDGMKALIQRISLFETYLDTYRNLYDARLEFLKTIHDSLQALVPALTDAHADARENTERLDKVINKMESYFGSAAGLEYDN